MTSFLIGLGIGIVAGGGAMFVYHRVVKAKLMEIINSKKS